jgi:hypothetical protein
VLCHSKLILADFRQLHQMPQQPGLQRRIAVDRHGKPHGYCPLCRKAAVDTQKNPAAPLDTALDGAKIGDSLLFITCGSK